MAVGFGYNIITVAVSSIVSVRHCLTVSGILFVRCCLVVFVLYQYGGSFDFCVGVAVYTISIKAEFV